MRFKPRSRYGEFALAVVLLFSCGPKKEEADSGGDHAPEDKVYDLAAQPPGATATGIAAQEVRAPFLRRFLEFADHYHVCLDHTAFDDTTLAAVQSLVQVRNGAPAGFGIEGIVNYVLATVDHFRPGTKPASSRVEIDVVWPDAGICDLVVTRVPGTQFPFAGSDFSGLDKVLFWGNHLRSATGTLNHIPVAFVDQALTGPDLPVAVQYLVGWYLGMAQSKIPASNLSATTSAETPGRGWQIADAAGTLRTDDDAQILYGFALVYRDVLKVADLDTLHNFQDQLLPSDQDQDTDLDMPANGANLTFAPALGNVYVNGARLIGNSVKVCVENVSGTAIDDTRLAAYFAFVAPDAAGSVISYLHDRQAAIATRVDLVTDGCNLLVYLKNTTQYPFATNKVNGLYAQEGTLRTKSGAVSTLPVIYLNAATLELDPAAQTSSNKPINLVLQHEFAHFLGFKHSASSQSIMSPAGYYATWDMAGGDDKIFDAFVAVWNAKQ